MDPRLRGDDVSEWGFLKLSAELLGEAGTREKQILAKANPSTLLVIYE